MTIYDLFLINKVYLGLVFRLSALVREDPSLFNGPILGDLRNKFSEGILLYDILESIYRSRATRMISGDQFKQAGLQREPDFYIREIHDVILFESKDFYMTGRDKLSYDFTRIENGLSQDSNGKPDRLGKAVIQLTTNIERLITFSLPLDISYQLDQLNILPVIIVHDPLYSAPGLNWWVNQWFMDQLDILRAKPTLAHFDFGRVVPITIVEVDTLIMYQSHFVAKELGLATLIREYQMEANLNYRGSFANEMAERLFALRSAMPFAEFVRRKFDALGIELRMDQFDQEMMAMGLS